MNELITEHFLKTDEDKRIETAILNYDPDNGQELLNRKYELIKQRIENTDDSIANTTVFILQICDAWNRELFSVSVFDMTNNNIMINKRSEKIVCSVDTSFVQQIRNVVKEHSDVILSEDYYIEESDYYDGYKFYIKLTDDRNIYYSVISNLQANRHDDSVYAKEIIRLIDEILALIEVSINDLKISDIFKNPSSLMRVLE